MDWKGWKDKIVEGSMKIEETGKGFNWGNFVVLNWKDIAAQTDNQQEEEIVYIKSYLEI